MGLFSLRVAPPRPVRYLLGAGGVALLALVWWLITMGAVETRLVSPVVLPSPRRYQRGRLTPYVASRVSTIFFRMGEVQIP